jgi:hypothetical protein
MSAAEGEAGVRLGQSKRPNLTAHQAEPDIKLMFHLRLILVT